MHCKKYNDVLDELPMHFKHSHIMPIKFPEDKELFDRAESLFNTGKIMFWREVNVQMRAFNDGKINLKPEYERKEYKKAMLKGIVVLHTGSSK